MKVRERTLEVLENNRGNYISGEELAKELCVSRNSVWKSIRALQSYGYNISAVTNKGYCLASDSDIISAQSIQKHISKYPNTFEIVVHKTIESTNKVAKELAFQGAKEGTVIISEEQTAGRGRLGRSFFSPAQTGLYMSIILRPNLTASQSLLITTATAVAVSQAIEKVSGKTAKIKWVNDVYCDEKKVSGILTEASFGLESGALEFVVLGIGINVKLPKDGFPPDIENIATALFEGEVSTDVRSQLAAEVLQNFWHYYLNLAEKNFLQEYKDRSLLIGREISVVSIDNMQYAVVLEIDDDCALKVQMKDGTVSKLKAGEVSIKL
ncbi:MAG: biotin--[acetyl-CoA-carboxylase] ligase [Clostridia bacterium]|nr:biotin--[acetyl-CoA-carboxylase] ligase [Clostridia bacterium]